MFICLCTCSGTCTCVGVWGACMFVCKCEGKSDMYVGVNVCKHMTYMCVIVCLVVCVGLH
jgi:hypothetical protein